MSSQIQNFCHFINSKNTEIYQKFNRYLAAELRGEENILLVQMGNVPDIDFDDFIVLKNLWDEFARIDRPGLRSYRVLISGTAAYKL